MYKLELEWLYTAYRPELCVQIFGDPLPSRVKDFGAKDADYVQKK
jgi:hypothetical protein